jgi:hypothetical protein
VKWKFPHRIVSVEPDYVFVVDNMLKKEFKAAHVTRLRFKYIRISNSTSLQRWPRTSSITSTNVRRVEDTWRAYNEQDMFNELFVAWRGFPVGEATWELYSAMAVDVRDGVEVHEVSR